MKTRLMLIIFALSILPTWAFAQTDDEIDEVWQKGNITFEYPGDWAAEEVLPGIVVVSNKTAVIESVLADPTEMLQSGDAIVVVINQTLMMEEIDIDPDDDLEVIAVDVGASLDDLQPPRSFDPEFLTLGGDDAVRLVWQEAGFAVNQIIIRREQGLIGMIAVAPKGELEDYAFIDQLAESLDYLPPVFHRRPGA